MGQPEGGGRLGGGQQTSPSARQKPARKLTGITRITREGGKQVYRLAFSVAGVQCRETIARDHSPANDRALERLRAEILGKIERREFRYQDYFPDSPKAVALGHKSGAPETVAGALAAYRDRVSATLAPSTFAGYRKAIDNVLTPAFGALRLVDLRPSHVREWVGLQTTTLKRIRNTLLPLRAILDEAVADELIASNPLDKLTLAKLVPDAQRRSEFEPAPYTEPELATLLRNLPEPERLAFQLWAYTGMRTGELIGLRWARVDLEANTVRVTETTTARQDKDRPKTAAGVRTIPLLPAAREAVDLMRTHTQLAADRVTTNPRSTRPDKAWDDKRLAQLWRRAHKDTGIAYRPPYQLRHTFASQLLSQGENPAYIARLLGHKTVEMVTRHYGRWVSEGERLGFERPPRQFGMRKLWAEEITQASHTPG